MSHYVNDSDYQPLEIRTSSHGDFYYWCPRCKQGTLDDNQMVPCPRGSCEAYIAGEIITTKQIIILKPLLDNDPPIRSSDITYPRDADKDEYMEDLFNGA